GTDPAEGPPPPTINSPLYDTEVTSQQPTLTIDNSEHAESVTLTYSYEVYADAAMTQLVASVDNVAEGEETTSWTVPTTLDDNTDYTWRVRAYDGTVYSLWTNGRFFVNTVNDAPGDFTVSSPVDGAEVDTLTPQLAVINAVDADGDTLSYRFEVSEYIDMSTLVTSAESIAPGSDGTTGWQVDVSLTENGYYYWRATAVDEHALETEGPISGIFINTTNEAPSAPSVNSPLSGDVVTSETVTLVVGNATDPEGDSLSYVFELDSVSSFDSSDLLASSDITEGSETTQWTFSDLTEDATYYWRVKANDGLVDSEWTRASFSVNATNEAPSTPTLSNPGNQSWVAELQPTLQINAATDPDGDTLEYRFELFNESDLTTAQDSQLTTETQWELSTELENHQWYFWHARSEDPSGEVSEWSSLSSFFVDDNGINDAPTLSFIEPAEDIEVSEATVTLRWDDSDPDSNASIALYYDNDSSGEDGVEIASALAEDDEGEGDLFNWSIATLPNGDYWVYGVIDDDNTRSVVYNSAVITVTGRVEVPDLLGLDQATAQSTLTDEGLSVGTVTEVENATAPIGEVIEQDPASGTALLPGTEVNMVVSAGIQTITDLSALAELNKVTLQWTSVSGAESYNIYRKTAAADAYELIAAGHVTDDCVYSDSGSILNVQYNYVVTSITNGIESAYSNVSSATMTASDSDNDGMSDSYEIRYGLDPNDSSDADIDSDGDNLTNLEEYLYNTDPFAVDSDNDGVQDDVEIAEGRNPNFNEDHLPGLLVIIRSLLLD
ncbi:MAG: PASTA domain-containing protein, partial [Candidatus Thiodiazotropha sp.]